MVWWLELRAKISGRGLLLPALAGQEDYNLTINSDLTVSCNCQDYDGTGHWRFAKKFFRGNFFRPGRPKISRRTGAGQNSDSHLCALHHPPAGKKRRAARAAFAVSRDAAGEHRASATWTASAARAKAPPPSAPSKTDAAGELGQMADLAARLGMERIFYLNLGEPFLSPTICQELPLLRAKNPERLHRGFDERHFAEHRRQARGGAALERHSFSVHGISDPMLRKIHAARQF